MEILELFCWMASNEVDEEIAKMEATVKEARKAGVGGEVLAYIW